MTAEERIRLLYYAAGYFDGEGCITSGINISARGECRAHVRVKVVTGDKECIGIFALLFGGHTSTLRKREGLKQMYRWEIYGKNCFPVLTELAPLLRSEKRDTAYKWIGTKLFGSNYQVLLTLDTK